MNVSAMAVMLAIGDEAHEAKTIANLYKAVDKGTRYGIPVMGCDCCRQTDGTRRSLLRSGFPYLC